MSARSTNRVLLMEPLRISTDIHDQDVALIHRFLSQETAWARQIPFETVRASVENSLNFGGFVGTAQVAYARVISDVATFAHPVDVFVRPQRRGKGYSAAPRAAVMS